MVSKILIVLSFNLILLDVFHPEFSEVTFRKLLSTCLMIFPSLTRNEMFKCAWMLLWSALREADILLFENAVKTLVELDSFFAQLRLFNWGISFQDDKEIALGIFSIIRDLVPLPERTVRLSEMQKEYCS